MAMEIAYDLETPASSDFTHIAGLSHDFRQAFDLIPVHLYAPFDGNTRSPFAHHAPYACFVSGFGVHQKVQFKEMQ